MDSAALQARSVNQFLLLILFAATIPRLPTVEAFTTSRGDLFKYYEVTNPRNGIGNHDECTESKTVYEIESMIAVNGAMVCADYCQTYNRSISSRNTENDQNSGTFTFSATHIFYVIIVGVAVTAITISVVVRRHEENVGKPSTNQPVVVDSS